MFMFSLNKETVNHFIPGYSRYDFNYSSCEKYFSHITNKIIAKIKLVLHCFEKFVILWMQKSMLCMNILFKLGRN